MPRVPALDGARGLAVVGVLLFHGGHLIGGYLGVDLFFTLSGFLITSLLLSELARTGGVSLGAFWARRVRRLVPALLVLLVGVAVYTRGWALPEQVGQVRGDVFATLAYVANWHEIAAHRSYFALFTGPSPLQHTWSLSIEEQFYVVWPLLFVGLVAVARRASATTVLVVSLGLASVSSVLMVVLYRPGDTSAAYFGTETRMAAILFGAALAAWFAIHGHTTSRQRRLALEGLGLVGAGVLAIAWTHLDGQSSRLYRGGFLLCGLATTAVLAAAMHPKRGPVSRALSIRPLRALGLISYGVYLYHWPLDVFLDEQRVGFGGWPLFGIRTGVTLAAAVVSYYAIEQPVRHGALSGRQLRIATPAVVATALLVVSVGAPGANSASASVSIDPSVRSAIATPVAATVRPLVGRATPVDVRRSQLRPTRVMVVGNSVAYFLGKSFEQLDTPTRLTVVDAALPGCVFPPEVNASTITMPNGASWKGTPCDPAWEADVVRNFRPQVVFWIVSNPTGTGGTYLGQHVEPCQQPWDVLYEQSLRNEVRVLGATGAEVVITTSAYTRFLGLKFNDRATDCDNQLRRQVAAESGAQLVDLFAYVCPQGRCIDQQDGITLRADGVHYTGSGGRLVAAWLMDQVH